MTIATVQISITAGDVAWYGAILGTLGFLLSLGNALRDRAAVVVSLSKDMVLTGNPDAPPNARYLRISISNRGRRLIRVSSVGLKCKGSTETILLVDSVKRPAVDLTEGKGHMELMDQESVDLTALRLVFVSDDTGREWVGRARIGGESTLYRSRLARWFLERCV